MLMEEIRRPERVEDIREGGPQEVGKKGSRDRWRFIFGIVLSENEEITNVIVWKFVDIAENSAVASFHQQSGVRALKITQDPNQAL